MESHFGQAESTTFFQQLDICCQKIAEKVGDKAITDWTNGDYVRLSGILLRQTKINLSENTLKRIFGKLKTSDRYHPQKATRDALAQFIGYRDWHEFELLNPVSTDKFFPLNKSTETHLSPESLMPPPQKKAIRHLGDYSCCACIAICFQAIYHRFKST